MKTDEAVITQYLSFTLGEELFAIEITRVREILDLTQPTRIPRTPEFVRGVINLRGAVVPVADIKLKFGMGRTEKSLTACIIIVEVRLDDASVVLGLLADSVREVFDLPAGSVEPAPRIGTLIDTSFLKGMGKADDRFIQILDVDKVFSTAEIEEVSRVQADANEPAVSG